MGLVVKNTNLKKLFAWPTDLSHDNVLAFLDELVLSLDDGLQELEVVDTAAVRFDAVHKVLHHPLINLTTQLEIIHEDMLHGHCLQYLETEEKKKKQKDRELSEEQLKCTDENVFICDCSHPGVEEQINVFV